MPRRPRRCWPASPAWPRAPATWRPPIARSSTPSSCRPRYADLHFQYGALLVQRGRRAEARRELDAALEIHPRYLAARVELAMLDAREGRIGEALIGAARACSAIAASRSRTRSSRASRASSAPTGTPPTRSSAARCAARIPRLDRQLERYRELMAEGSPERAADVLREALERHEAYPDLHALLGACELGLGHFDDALCSFARALELNPDFHGARVQIALALDALGDRAGASEQLGLVLQAEPDQAQALETFGALAAAQRVPAANHESRNRP